MTENEEGLTLPIYFRNAQWAVTGYGIESVDRNAGAYAIDADRLGETRGELPDWPLHLAEKIWVNSDLFMEAFMIGLWVHRGKYNEEAFLQKGWMERIGKQLDRIKRIGF